MLEVLQIYYENNIEAKERRIDKVKEGIRFILTHFEGRQPLFPRKMSTSLSQGRQFTIYNEEQILNECIKANFIDCRLSAYHVLSDDDMAAAIQAPNLLFIDLDLPTLNYEYSLPELNNVLSKSLKIIKRKLEGCIPTILWTGNGYHTYIVLDTRPLKLITDLAELSRQPSKVFLKYAEITFTNKMADSKHNHSFNSYLLRIPHTFNSKCNDKDKNSEVKIIQKFDPQNVSQINGPLLREFRIYLADLDIKNKRACTKQESKVGLNSASDIPQSTIDKIPHSYGWIETLLQTPISDHRKFTIDLLLVPYLLNIRHLSSGKTFFRVANWIFKCNALRALQPTVNNFLDSRIKLAIDRAGRKPLPPIKRETMKKNYPDWYKDFEQWHLFGN